MTRVRMGSRFVVRRLAVGVIALAVGALGLAATGGATAETPTGPLDTVTGTVVDQAGNPVAGASVHAARTERFTLTDGAGAFTLTEVPGGSSEVVAAKEGYAFAHTVRTGDSPVTVRMSPQTEPPRPEYPRPDADRRPFTNDAWRSLNGTWSFDFDPSNVGESEGWFDPSHQYSKAIQVPFSYQSLAAFGEQHLATADVFRSAFDDYNGVVWYRRDFTVPQSFADQHTRLRIGAAYWGFSVWLDGQKVQPYVDYGDTEWVVDLGALEPGSDHTLAIRVEGREASTSSPFPIGRQDRFANKGGIWQSVWIEPVRANWMATPQVRTDLTFPGDARQPSAASATVQVRTPDAASGTADVVVKDPDGQQVAAGDIALTNGVGEVELDIPQPKLWDIGQPNLYTADVTLTDGGTVQDGVRVSFGLRKIERKAAPTSDEYQYVYLNNRPIYLRGVLDQGYNPWGTVTPTGEVTGADFTTGTAANPAPGSIAYDLKHIQAQGYNLVRTHVKVFEPAYYHWADKLGLLVWIEMPNPGREQMFDDDGALFRQFEPRYEGLLRSALAINANRPSIAFWGLFNEGWGAVVPGNDLHPLAISFIKQMAGVVRSADPGGLVVDNSACCENGHTSVTDIHDVHAGYGGFDVWKTFLDEYDKGMKPGSRWKMAEGTQSGQPWLLSEVTINRGQQLTNFSMYRSYPKIAGYIVVQFADQEDEMASQFTYDRTDRGPEWLDHTRTERAADLFNGDDAVAIMRDSHANVEPGQTLNLPIKLSHFSDLDLSDAQLHWKVAGRDRDGAWVDPGVGGSRAVAPDRYTVTDAGSIEVTIPEPLNTGYVWVWLEAGGKTMTENLVTFNPGTPIEGGFDLMSPTEQSWSGGTQAAELQCGPQQVVGYGAGYFEYTATVPPAAQDGGSLVLEASSAESPNPNNNLQFTTARKFPTDLEVTVDGEPVSTTTLPDDPADPRGLTARSFGRYQTGLGNHYGYRVSVPLSATLLEGKSTVTVRIASSGGGLRLFGAYAGDHGVPPRIVAGSSPSPVPEPEPTMTDRPSVSFSPALLNDENTGTAIVSVVNDTDATVNGVQARLDLPPGWTATPVDSSDVGALPPAGFAHVAYTVQAPAGSDAEANATATAVWTDSGSTVRSVQADGVQPAHPVAISDPSGNGSSLSGDAKDEPVCVQPGGHVIAQYNRSEDDPEYPLLTWPWADRSAVVGTELPDPTRVRFADLDGDGKSDLTYIQPNGEIVAWRNVRGFADSPWEGAPVTIADGFTDPNRVRFADLNADRKAEIIDIEADGQVRAWRNVGGIGPNPWGESVVIADGMADPDRVLFTDLNADRKAEIAYVQTSGVVEAWRNKLGFAAHPYAESVPVGDGFTDPGRVRFADLNGDGKAELLSIEPRGSLRAWRNVRGFAANPWQESAIIGYGFTHPERVQFA